jgi:fructose-bisphosphate aldolase class I
MPALTEVAASMVASGKGILAADESIGTMSKRLAAAGVPASAAARRDYRELLLTTPGLAGQVSGVIWCDETLRQSLADGTPFPAAARNLGIHPGIKVDAGVTPLPFSGGATVTEGLDGLRGRLEEYRAMGAVFAKWRAVLAPDRFSPRAAAANAHALARYAALCQEAGLAAIVEPEVLMDGSHGIGRCEEVTAATLDAVFGQLALMGVDPAGIVLKPNMVIEADGSEPHAEPDEVARRTLGVLRAAVPASVPGIAFLSGGQSNERACANLAAINAAAGAGPGRRAPWRLTYSFGRALVSDALHAWHGDPGRIKEAQGALAANCARASAASGGARGRGDGGDG